MPQVSQPAGSSLPSSVRFRIYALLILVSAGVMFGRIAAVDNVADRAVQDYRIRLIPGELARRRVQLEKKGLSPAEINKNLVQAGKRLLSDAQKERPTLSANDRSRLLTIRALVEPDARVYRYIPLSNMKLPSGQTGQTVLRNCGCPCPQQFNRTNASERYYTKQWVPYAIDKAMESPGWDTIDMVKHGLTNEPFDPADPLSGYLYSSKPTLLPTLMAIPYAVLYHGFGLSLETQPFATLRILLVIYNLIPLVVAMFLMAIMIDRLGKTDWGRFFAVAVFAFATFVTTFVVTVNNHVPCVVCVVFALYGAFRVEYDGDRRFRWFALTGFFGALAVACELPAAAVAFLLFVFFLVRDVRKTLLVSLPSGLLVVAGFFGTNVLAHDTLKPAYAMKRDHMQLARQDSTNKASDNSLVTSFDPKDWYIYNYIPSGRTRDIKNARLSYWANRVGIDRGESSHSTYFLHATIGHHGVFSLTPVWLLSMIGSVVWLARKNEQRLRWLAGTTLALTILFFVFYMTRDEGDRNYGGMTCGLRWFFPLIPFWLPVMLPVLDSMEKRRSLRTFATILLVWSVASACYALWNPWSHPWLYNALLYFGWIAPW
ncbi:MAG: glycosyltransferase family 39 protein [Planctomycetia bacterium]|nr:glycosyltransferase family 39 protein [Planctomycetia bacterium]